MSDQPKTNSYQPLVEIKDVEDFRKAEEVSILGDRRDGKLYRYTEVIKLAINVALATGRPLLVLGASGCGKSCLAFNLARLMQRRYYEFVVTSRSQARDLLYRFDAVRRLGDSHFRVSGEAPSQTIRNKEDSIWQNQYPYVEPGPLWWILDSTGARRRGYPHINSIPFSAAVDPAVWQPKVSDQASAVLLIDEIDKAEPDFPNNLLVPLGSWQFTIEEIAQPISLASNKQEYDPKTHPLVIITSNRERELPETFLRRCIVLEIPSPTQKQLIDIAISTFGQHDDEDFKNIADKLVELRGQDRLSVAEFLDAVQAIRQLKATGSSLTDIIVQNSWRPNEP